METQIINNSAKFNKLSYLLPESWDNILHHADGDKVPCVIQQYNHLEHFKATVSKLTDKCPSGNNRTYKTDLKNLLKGTPQIDNKEYEVIKNRVKQTLVKRGLISDTIYESYKYDIEGDIVDVAKVIAEDPMCCLVPANSYKEHFYELYINISYPFTVTNDEVQRSMAKLLATIELLEREHYYCKVTLVFPAQNVTKGSSYKTNYFSSIPLFSHKEHKSIEKMSSVLNSKLLRVFYFAILEDTFKDDLSGGYGSVLKLPYSIVPDNELNEVELCESIIKRVITPCKN